MKLEALILVAALASAAAEDSSVVSVGVDRSLIKDLLDKIISEFQGEKKQFFEKIQIAKGSRLENAVVESHVDNITLDMEDKLPNIIIKAFKAPIKLLRANGLYRFQDLLLPGGLTIYGNGKFTICFEDLNLSLLLQLRHSSAKGWSVKDVGVAVSLRSFLMRFENLMEGEPLGDFIHSMINQLVPVVVELLPGLVEENKVAVMEIISKVLNAILGGSQIS